jgi:MFS family permease
LAGDADELDRNWSAVAAATVGLIFSQGTLLLYTFGVFARPLGAEFGWSRTQLAVALAVGQYTFALSAPVWGALIDRFGPRPVLVESVVCLSALIGSLALLTPHLWHYYLVFAAVSLCAGAASPLGYSAVLVRKFDQHLGLALGLALMGVGIGAAVLPPVAQALTAAFGWRQAYAVFGAVTLAVTLPAALVATRGTGRPASHRARVATASVLPYVRTRAFGLMCAIFLLLGAVSVGTLASLVPIMIGRGFSPQEAAGIAGVTGLVAIAGRGGIGWVLDRVHPPYVVAAVALLALCAFLLLAYGQGTASAYLIAGLLGAVIGSEVDFTAFLVRRYFGSAVFGRLYGLAFGIFIVGSGTGPVLASTSFDRFGSYRPGALLFAAASVAVVLLALVMPAAGAVRARAGR